ncbi:hypothetical protein B0T11DRAFT_57468 [Plectosphaerella cucumerina]|uniref:Uncharacterized protein n=1 Tax=Plectosphaerella cucumerina TaxID=40658 RepID=A0A8K0THP9_9PEZI|nr:hypothetical protein B0T11DRAFT_57468 [Plectosphaerella cucumerina]
MQAWMAGCSCRLKRSAIRKTPSGQVQDLEASATPSACPNTGTCTELPSSKVVYHVLSRRKSHTSHTACRPPSLVPMSTLLPFLFFFCVASPEKGACGGRGRISNIPSLNAAGPPRRPRPLTPPLSNAARSRDDFERRTRSSFSARDVGCYEFCSPAGRRRSCYPHAAQLGARLPSFLARFQTAGSPRHLIVKSLDAQPLGNLKRNNPSTSLTPALTRALFATDSPAPDPTHLPLGPQSRLIRTTCATSSTTRHPPRNHPVPSLNHSSHPP